MKEIFRAGKSSSQLSFGRKFLACCDNLSHSVKKVYESCTRRSSALTIGEFLISLAVIGALAVILIPIYKTAKPDTIDAKHKKATYTVERIVNELSTDTYLYGNNGAYSGFNNITPVDHNGTSHGGLTKFCTLFASRINQKPGTALNCSPGHVSITSVEGIDWYLPITDFSDGPATITVDVNGGEGPNELGEDRFEYTVQPGQKTEVVETHFNPPTVAPPCKTRSRSRTGRSGKR